MNNKNGKNNTTGKRNELMGLLETVFITMFAVTMVFTYILRIAVVQGESMENTLMPEDRIVASAIYFTPENGDIILVNAEEAFLLDDEGNIVSKNGLGKQIVKRIIAVEGQTVNIDFERGAVYVDGVMLDEEYITGLTHIDEGAFTGEYPVEVPEGYVFVMGDNRGVSKDSRSAEIGFVSEDSIFGKVIFRLSPVKDFGFIE